jgi:hypothetical protein
MQARVTKQLRLEGVRTDLNQPRFNFPRIYFVAGSDAGQQGIFVVCQRTLSQSNSFCHGVLVPLANAFLIPPSSETDTVAFDTKSLRAQ